MTPPLSRDLPCPEPTCGHPHLYLPCDWCDCVSVTVCGVYPEES